MVVVGGHAQSKKLCIPNQSTCKRTNSKTGKDTYWILIHQRRKAQTTSPEAKLQRKQQPLTTERKTNTAKIAR